MPKKLFGTGYANAAAYSPDGKLIATGNGAGAFLWDATNGNQIRRFPGPLEDIRGVVFSPDGAWFATSSHQEFYDGDNVHVWTYVRVCDVASGDQLWETAPPQEVSQIAFSIDGQTILGRSSMNEGSFVFLWTAATGQLQQTLSGQYEMHDAAFSPDGSLVVTGCGDRRARIWDATNGQELRVLQGHSERVDSAVFSPDGSKILTSCGMDGTARIWDVSSGALLHTLWNDYGIELSEGPIASAFSTSGDQVLTGAYFWKAPAVVVRLWNAGTGELEREWEHHIGEPYDIASVSLHVSSDAMKALILRDPQPLTPGGMARILDLSDDAAVVDILLELGAGWAALSPDESSMVVIDNHQGMVREARLWNAGSGEKICDLGTGDFRALALSSDGTTLATAAAAIDVVGTSTVTIWDLESGREQRRFTTPHSELRCLEFSPNGTKLLAAGGFGTAVGATIWDPITGDLLHHLVEPVGGVLFGYMDGTFSPDDSQVLFGVAGGTGPQLTLWDAETGTRIKAFTGLPHYPIDVEFAPVGDRVVAALDWEGVLMWDVATGSLLQTFQIPQDGRASSACFSPDGQQVLVGLSASQPNETLLWDAKTGELLRTFPHDSPEHFLARFSPNGQWVLAGSCWERRILDISTGEHLYTMYASATHNAFSDSFSPDGRNLFTVANGAVAMWELVPTPELTITMETDGRIVLAWQNPAGASPCALERCGDVSAGDWTDVTLTTPGRYEFTDPSGTTFYRLKEP